MSTSRPMLAGAAAFVVGPLLALVGALVVPTLSDEGSDRVSALVDHRGAEIGGFALQTVGLALLIAGSVWLALALARRAPGLAVAGGVLAVFSYFVIALENGVTIAAAAIVPALGPAQATTALDAVGHSAGVSAVEPLSVLEIVGFALFAFALRRTAAPVWAAVGLVVASAVETAGFATGTKALVAIGFVLLAAAAAVVARALVGGAPAEAPSVQPAAGTVS